MDNKLINATVAVPLIDYEDETLVIDFIPPMELHLMLGIVNRLYDHLDKALEKSGVSVRAKDWSDQLYITRRHYHGGQFIGNHCSKLLNEFDKLENLLVDSEAYIGIPYVETFRKFKLVKDMCFGFNLCEGYEVAIDQFKIAYLNLGIPVSLKVHIVFEHVVQFCKKNITVDLVYIQSMLQKVPIMTSSHFGKNPTKLQ